MKKGFDDIMCTLLGAIFMWLIALSVILMWHIAPSVTDTHTETCKYACVESQVKGYYMPEVDDLTQALASVPAADPDDITRLAQMLWGEARGIPSQTRKAAVIWCVFNRIDDPAFPDTIAEVCIASQFNGYSPDNPVDPELYDLCMDVYIQHCMEQNGYPANRVLPKEYVYFHGDGKENYFRTEYQHTGNYWEWSLPSMYGD